MAVEPRDLLTRCNGEDRWRVMARWWSACVERRSSRSSQGRRSVDSAARLAANHVTTLPRGSKRVRQARVGSLHQSPYRLLDMAQRPTNHAARRADVPSVVVISNILEDVFKRFWVLIDIRDDRVTDLRFTTRRSWA